MLNPAFIVGVARSGTTLLVNLMGDHPLLAPLYETRFLRNVLELCGRASWFWGGSLSRKFTGLWGKPFVRARFLKDCQMFRRKAIAYNTLSVDGSAKQPYESFPFGQVCIHYHMDELVRETDAWLKRLQNGHLSHEEVYRSARDYVDRLFSIHCDRMNKPYWINKTPGLLSRLRQLPLLFPNANCIHIMRDGRDVAASNLSLDWGPDNVRDAARRWKRLILEGRKSVDQGRMQYRELRYEHLIESPRKALAEAFRFVGLEAQIEDILSRIPVSSGRVGGWRKVLAPKDQRIFASEAGDLLIELGYEKDYNWVG